jgi:hypothetical protein
MKERLEMVGGTFTVTFVPGKSTTVQAEIPLVNARNGERQAKRMNSLGAARLRTFAVKTRLWKS